ncbi:hypothetical protein [Paradevosia shaoguanensis]|uniref:DUF7303 family protein n=1 Tax=Paradevosia shaoguanensis TaxID=1335043 RepID=UPI001931D895|nr:hypothetical protein [Paradevosia shaoguanensis]
MTNALKVASNTEFRIEKNVPLPERARRARYPFHQMEIGDSFFATDKRANYSAYAFGVRNGVKFVCRAENNGYRIWRIA